MLLPQIYDTIVESQNTKFMKVINQKQTRVSLELPESLIKIIDRRAAFWNLKRASYIKFLVMTGANETRYFGKSIIINEPQQLIPGVNSPIF